MIKEEEISIRAATSKDRAKIAQLIQFESYVHRHLDWRPPLDWIGNKPYFIAERRGRIISALACPPDPSDISWVRVFAATGKFGGEKAWSFLWPETKETLKQMGTKSIVAIPLQDWFKNILTESNFSYIHDVIVLDWESKKIVPPSENKHFVIRPVRPVDLETINRIDEKAFGSLWRNSYETLELAFKQALVATAVVNKDDHILGYQISTPSPFGAHLARLAVLPEKQGLGIGTLLIQHLQSIFEERVSTRLSVNTQDNNIASLALYDKTGFKLTGEKYPVYKYDF